MKRLPHALLAAAMLLTGGCVLTLNSIFTKEDVTYDKELEGAWQKDGATWTIKPFDAPGGRYRMQTEMGDQPTAHWYATLGTIGTNRFLELVPRRPPEIHEKSFYGGHFLELRSFWKVQLDNDTLTLTSMSFKWLESMLKQKKVDISFHGTDDKFHFLTGSTKELQEFIKTYGNDPGAFPSTGDEKGFVFSRKAQETKKDN